MAATNAVTSRHSPRQKGTWPITLLARAGGDKIKVPAVTKDLSSVGLRIQSHVSLTTGEQIDVLFADQLSRPRACQVMWTKVAGASVPSEAGLKFLGVIPWLRKLV